jgi:hypothetical protein
LGCLALAVGAGEIGTHLLSSVSDRHDHAALTRLVGLASRTFEGRCRGNHGLARRGNGG